MSFFDDLDPQLLLNEVHRLFNPSSISKQDANTIPLTNKGYQAPIKSTWYNSGGFNSGGALRPNGRKGHDGVDMRAQGGTSIYPIAPGIVTSVGTDPLGGNVVNVQHANNVRTYYAHMATAKVHKGDKVNYDTILGTVGDTGNAKNTVYHLHFQVWENNQLMDPAKFFSIPPYTNVSAEEKAKNTWVSDQARQEAAAFNMRQHNQNNKLSFSVKVHRLLKLASQFNKLSQKLY